MKRKDIPMESLYDLREIEGKIEPAGTYNKERGPHTDLSFRSTLKKEIDHHEFFDINYYLLNMINVWDGALNPKDYIVKEYNYLIYNEGDHFKKHRDVLPADNPRIFSTSTIISYTDDFEGGEFGIWSDDGYSSIVDLQPGETIFFDSNTQHQVFPVKKGTREVLVAWIYKK